MWIAILALFTAVDGFLLAAPPKTRTSLRGTVDEEIASLVRLTEEMADQEGLQKWVTSQRRYFSLCGMLKNRTTYKRAAETLLFYGVPRLELPNLEFIEGPSVNVTFNESPLEQLLLSFTRLRYKQLTGFESDEPGIKGLLSQMQQYAEDSSLDSQKNAVLRILRNLMTPFLPPFYKFFVTGKPWQDFATAVVAPLVFSYLVGPATPNRRSDGRLGGLVVHRCKFLQESNCKGLCLHSCKLPAQELFANDLNVSLSVKPNFQTFECQWSWGLPPLDPAEDPDWPSGCLPGCTSRLASSSSLINDDSDSDSTRNPPPSPFCV